LRGAVALAGDEAIEALLDVGRQLLQRADVEFLRRVLDALRIDA
jgi:hypothetical protein